MKNKTKVVLGLAAMLAGTVAVAGVSTFAWFSTNANVNVNFAQAHVVSDLASIAIQYLPVLNNQITNDTTTPANGMVKNGGKDFVSAVNIEGATIQSRDISGDGKQFYRPTWDDFTNKIAGSYNSITSDSNSASKQYFVTFGLAVKNNGAAKTQVYLGADSLIKQAVENSHSAQAVKATRIAIWEATDVPAADPVVEHVTFTGTAPLAVWHQDETDKNKATGNKFEYLSTGNATDSAYGDKVKGYKLNNLDYQTAGSTFHVGKYTDPSYSAAYTTAMDAYIAEGTGAHDKTLEEIRALANVADHTGQFVTYLKDQNEVKYLIVSMWLEGTVAAADDTCIGGDVSMTLQLTAKAPVA